MTEDELKILKIGLNNMDFLDFMTFQVFMCDTLEEIQKEKKAIEEIYSDLDKFLLHLYQIAEKNKDNEFKQQIIQAAIQKLKRYLLNEKLDLTLTKKEIYKPLGKNKKCIIQKI